MKTATRDSTVALPVLGLAALGLAVQQDKPQEPKPAADAGYICPLTGETLPCPGCCPANK